MITDFITALFRCLPIEFVCINAVLTGENRPPKASIPL